MLFWFGLVGDDGWFGLVGDDGWFGFVRAWCGSLDDGRVGWLEFVYTWALPVVCAIVVGFLINGYPVYVSSLFPFLYIELTSSDPSLNI